VEIGLVKVENVDMLNKLEVLPNPTADHAFLNVEFDYAVDLEILLIDGTGKLLDSYREQQIQQLAHRMDMRTYPNGIYFVQINYDNYTLSYKLVVNH
ncbi:MAG: T9SS type A sorting domain-containing protein, partial [Bacteroidota bacterium]